MSRNDHGAAILVVHVDGLVENKIERLNLALQASAVLYVDERILRGGEDVTCGNNVGTPEVHNAIAVCTCILQGEDLHRFAIVVFPAAVFKVSVAGRSGRGRLLPPHMRLNILMADNRRPLACIGKLI